MAPRIGVPPPAAATRPKMPPTLDRLETALLSLGGVGGVERWLEGGFSAAAGAAAGGSCMPKRPVAHRQRDTETRAGRCIGRVMMAERDAA
jgi:hypothetical protein